MTQDRGQLETTLRRLSRVSRSALGREALLTALPLAGLLANLGSMGLIDSYEMSDWAKSTPWFKHEYELGFIGTFPLGYIVFWIGLGLGALLLGWLCCFTLQRWAFKLGYGAARRLLSYHALSVVPRSPARLAAASVVGCTYVIPFGCVLGAPLTLVLTILSQQLGTKRADYHGQLAALCDHLLGQG